MYVKNTWYFISIFDLYLVDIHSSVTVEVKK